MHRSQRKSLGTIQQQQQKQPKVYENVVRGLKLNQSLLDEQTSQANILQDIQSFHKYYSDRCEDYKLKWQKANQLNWQYTTKIAKYEKSISDYEMAYIRANDKAKSLEERMHEMRKGYQRIQLEYSHLLDKKERQIVDLRAQIAKFMLKNEVSKKKVVKLKQHGPKITQDQTLNIESARSTRQMKNIKNELSQTLCEIQQLSKENDNLCKKVLHLEADRKYEDQRIKSATLALELDLKIKEEQINRLNQQLQVYELKFNEIMLSFKSGSSTQLKGKQNQILFSGFLKTKADENQKVIYDNSLTIDSRPTQKTQRKDSQSAEKTSKKSHRRHGSLNIRQNKMENINDDLCMKIKVYKFNKNKKYI